jgi:hypothetical protein
MEIQVTKTQLDILRAIGILYSSKKDVNPFSISKIVGCSWITAKKNLIKFKGLK